MKKSKITKRILVWTFSNMWFVSVWAQIPVEISVGHSGYYYQHSFAAKFNPEKPVGFFHTSSVLIPYDKNRGNEIMSQSYVSYTLSEHWTSGIGSIFTPLDRVRPSVFFQYFQKKRTTSVLVFPRIDIWSEPNFEMMGFIEYRQAGRQNIKIYARLQYMTTWNLREHVRSYQYGRVGIDMEEIQFGLAANFDQYGSFATSYNSIGIFVRKEF
ncbi:hypothetical protein [Sinomicrobium sp. M5D2P9]